MTSACTLERRLWRSWGEYRTLQTQTTGRQGDSKHSNNHLQDSSSRLRPFILHLFKITPLKHDKEWLGWLTTEYSHRSLVPGTSLGKNDDANHTWEQFTSRIQRELLGTTASWGPSSTTNVPHRGGRGGSINFDTRFYKFWHQVL